MLNLNGLGISQSVISSLNTAGISADSDVLSALEQYKYVTHKKMLEYLKNEYKDIIFVTMPIDAQKFNDAFFVVTEQEVFVYYNYLRPVNEVEIELELTRLHGKDIIFKCVTPFDYDTHAGMIGSLDPTLVFQRIVREALDKHATDIHFDVIHKNKERSYTVRFRIGLDLVPCTLFKIDESLNSSIISKLIEHDTAISSTDLLDPSGVTASAADVLGDNSVELRISANKVLGGYQFVCRLQTKSTVSLSIDELGFPESVASDLKSLSDCKAGLTLITGAIRTGKNTTAFAIANSMLERDIKIVSYESPIEVLMPFTQIDYFGDENVLSNAVRLAKKQDINVAFLNEIPDKTVAFAVLDLVNSSAHVVTTMHVNRLWHVPYKLKEFYGDNYKDVISQVNGIINQKMCVKACPNCRTQVAVDALPEKYSRILGKYGKSYVSVSQGCPACGNTGLDRGKLQPYAEHLVFNSDLQSELLKCKEPFEMEYVLHEATSQRKQSLEDYIVHDVSIGELPLNTLDYLD